MILSSNAPLRAQDSPAVTRRRSRRTAAAIATTVGAAAVVGVTYAGPADAAGYPHGVWDRVASCESSQRWHIATGNGYYGGLQFSASTWAAFHGHKYAAQASGATRAEQIEVARRVLAEQGPHAWPVCGPRAGLTRSDGGATQAPLPRVAGARTHRAAAPQQHARKAAHRRAYKARHHRAAVYRVHRGDTLAAIARRLHVRGGWPTLYRANRKHMSDPDVLHIGQRLLVP